MNTQLPEVELSDETLAEVSAGGTIGNALAKAAAYLMSLSPQQQAELAKKA